MALYTIYPAHPDWNSSDMSLFDNCYEPIVRIIYPLRDPKPKLITIRLTKSKRCALCYSSDQKKFSHTAHLLPAALGNRHYTSDEECDDCNSTFGEEYENALANMLAAERAFYRVRTRKRAARLQLKGTTKHLSDEEGRSFIGGGRYDGELHIKVHKSDNSITTRDEEDNTLIVNVTNPSYSSTKALKSILKSFWLSANDSTRDQFDYIRKYIINDPGFKQKESEIFKYFLADAPDAVVFEAWKKKSNVTTKTSDLVIRLSMAHTSIIWCSPDPTTHIHAPSLLPPVLQDKLIAKLNAVKILCPADESLIKAHGINFSFTYNSRVRTIEENPGEAKRSEDLDDSKNRPAEPERVDEEDEDYPAAIPVLLEASVGDMIQKVADAKVVTYRLDTQFMIFRILGGQFAANLLMQINLETQDIAFREDYTFHRYSAILAGETLDLLMLAYKPGSQLRAVIKGTDQELFAISFFRGEAVPEILTLYKEMLTHLLVINPALEADYRIRIGKRLFSLDLQCARRLVRIISTGREERPMQGIHFKMDKVNCEMLKKHLEGKPQKKHLTVRLPDDFITFMNDRIDLGPIRLVLDSPSIDRAATLANSTSDDESSTIWLRAARTTIYYERWESTETTSELT